MNKGLARMQAIVLWDTCAFMSFVIRLCNASHLPMRHESGMLKLPFSLISVIYIETSGGHAAASLKKTSNSRAAVTVRLCVSPLPTARGKRASFDLEAGMAFCALDCQNPVRFHVVSILPEKGHCYRLNNLRHLKAETGSIHVPD